MILTLGLLGALQTMLIGGFAGYYLSDSLYDEIGQRALMVAKTVAATPPSLMACAPAMWMV